MLAIPGAHVTGVVFTPDGIAGRPGRREPAVLPVWLVDRAVYHRVRRCWRSLDLGASKVSPRAEVRRLRCGRCGSGGHRGGALARPGARGATRLLRCSREAAAPVVTRVLAEQLDAVPREDDYRIGVEEVPNRKGVTVPIGIDRGTFRVQVTCRSWRPATATGRRRGCEPSRRVRRSSR